MSYYVLFYDYVPDMSERRKPYREAHLALVREWFAAGRLLMAGALTEPLDSAMLVFSVDKPGDVQPFVDQDPYIEAGLVRGFRVRPWTVVVGPI
jgi:uncharacterized protein YciI